MGRTRSKAGSRGKSRIKAGIKARGELLYCNNKKFRNMKKSKRGAKFSSKCKRKSDGKVFDMPRLYSFNECKKDMSGFTKRSSCAPFNIK